MSKKVTSFTKRDLVLSIQKFDPNTGQPYSDQSNTPQITFMGDKCADLDHYQPGQLVRVSFDVIGRQYVGSDDIPKIINDIRGYRIEPYGVQGAPQPAPAASFGNVGGTPQAVNNAQDTIPPSFQEEDDKLPF